MAKKNNDNGIGSVYPPVRFPVMGRPLKFTPKQIQEKFLEYVQWCKDNPIILKTTVEATSVDGTKYGNDTINTKPRLISIGGFLVFIGATRQWWSDLDDSKTENFSDIKALIRDFCEEYQKEMASAGIFNGNIISRLLGLVEKQQQEHKIENRIVVDSKEQADKIARISQLD